MKTLKEYLNGRTISGNKILNLFVREVFGSYFIEEGRWNFSNCRNYIGRTFFSDRKSKKIAINAATTRNIQELYRTALYNESFYDPKLVSQRFTQICKKNFYINFDYLIFYDDDPNELRKRKIGLITHLIWGIFSTCQDIEAVEIFSIHTFCKKIEIKAQYFLVAEFPNTYTAIVIKNLHLTDPLLE